MARQVQNSTIETLVDGMIDLFKVNLVANTVLTQDAHVGDTVLHVDNSIRFMKFDHILLMDNHASQDGTNGALSGVEFHRVIRDFQDTGLLYIEEPLEKDFLVSDHARLQKSIKKTILYEKDILYGDRQVINFDGVAICVEPESKTQDWLAVRLLGTEVRMAIMVYIKCGGLGDEEEYALRVCNAYADAINKLLLGNIHIDISVDSTKLVRDAHAGDTGVWIGCNVAEYWQPGMECLEYEVQDNHGANQLLKIIDPNESSSSLSLSSFPLSSSTDSLSSASSTSTSTSVSSLESTRTTASSGSSQSWSSQSITSPVEDTSGTSTSSSVSSPSSLSTGGGGACWIGLDKPLTRDFLVLDKAVIRRKERYTYDSRVSNIEYGTTQKGSVLIKAAKLSWFGKEAEAFQFPQVGIGR